MKKLLGIVVLVLLWCSAGFADKSFDSQVKNDSQKLKKFIKDAKVSQYNAIKKWQHDPEGRKLIALMLLESGDHNWVEAQMWLYIISKTNPDPTMNEFMKDTEKFLNENELSLSKKKADEWLKKNQ